MSVSLLASSVAVTLSGMRFTRDVPAATAISWRAALRRLSRERHERNVRAAVMATDHPGVIADFERAARAR